MSFKFLGPPYPNGRTGYHRWLCETRHHPTGREIGKAKSENCDPGLRDNGGRISALPRDHHTCRSGQPRKDMTGTVSGERPTRTATRSLCASRDHRSKSNTSCPCRPRAPAKFETVMRRTTRCAAPRKTRGSMHQRPLRRACSRQASDQQA